MNKHSYGDQTRIDPLDQSQFRTALGRFPSGVVAVTGSAGEQPLGMTIQSFAAVSLDPPMVLICPASKSSTWPRIFETGSFCVNVLQFAQKDICLAMAQSGVDKFRGVDWTPSPRHGNPVIAGSAAWFDCSISEIHTGGDHVVVLGTVVDAASTVKASDPLVFHTSAFGRCLAPDASRTEDAA